MHIQFGKQDCFSSKRWSPSDCHVCNNSGNVRNSVTWFLGTESSGRKGRAILGETGKNAGKLSVVGIGLYMGLCKSIASEKPLKIIRQQLCYYVWMCLSLTVWVMAAWRTLDSWFNTTLGLLDWEKSTNTPTDLIYAAVSVLVKKALVLKLRHDK